MPRKLTSLKPRLGSLKPRFGYAPGDEKGRDRYRRQSQPSKTWLKSAWWLKARQRILLRDRYTCQGKSCGRLVAGKGEAHIDHIVPHNESHAAFHCDDAGLQTLCVDCHVSKKQREERREGLIR
jgi:5-methylcytosine-specific restriction protein A